MKLGEKLFEKRKRKGYTQEAVADMLGVTPQAVSKWENGASCPDITLLPKIAKLYETTVDELLSEDEVLPVAYVAPEGARKSVDDTVLRIMVNDKDDRVKINIPMVLVRAMVAGGAGVKIGKSELDIAWNMVIELIERGAVGRILEVEGSGGETVVVEVI